MNNQDKKRFLLYVWQPEVQCLECPADTVQRRNVAKHGQNNFFAAGESARLTLRRHCRFSLAAKLPPSTLAESISNNPGTWIKGNS